MRAMRTQDRVDSYGRSGRRAARPWTPSPSRSRPRPIRGSGGRELTKTQCAGRVRLADGVRRRGLDRDPRDFVEQAGLVREGARSGMRHPASFRVAKRVYLGVDDDARRAQQRTGDALNDLYGYFGLQGIERVAVAGRPDDVAGQLADIAAAGAGLILLNPLFDEAEQMERLSAEAIPQLADALVRPGISGCRP